MPIFGGKLADSEGWASHWLPEAEMMRAVQGIPGLRAASHFRSSSSELRAPLAQPPARKCGAPFVLVGVVVALSPSRPPPSSLREKG